MGTLNGLLDLSQNALLANQAAIAITSNNVANANTPGYTAQTATWTERDSVTLSGGVQVGQGVKVGSQSQRDRVLEHRVQQQTQVESSSAARSDALGQLQSIFGLTSNTTTAVSTTLGADLNSFFNSVGALEATPTNASVRQGVLSAAATLASDLNSSSAEISQQTTALNQQVPSIVGTVNSLTASIASLNLQIESSSPNADAGTLEDQRQLELTQLSQYVGFNQTTTENNGLTLTTTNGSLLVSQGQSYALSTTAAGGNIGVLDSTGANITASLTGGSLAGVIEARDQDLPAVASALDQLAYSIGTAVNTQNQAGLDAAGNAGGALFTLPASAVGAAGSIALATVNPNAIAAAAVGEGVSGDTNATALVALGNTGLVGGQTAAQYYASLLTQLGSKVAQVTDENTTQQASLTQLTTQRSAQSSVSLDQEAASLTQYQRSYEAAAKIFTIVDQLMATSLNLGVDAAVS
ncbi:MAG TPA: flagellar hook-associated protein FlgK [Acidobacteriaceae bacterium]|nr:flagellar hook-associated protein FlgK [Acidobacteriaceae bacterium]